MRSEAVSVNGQTDATLILTLTETESVTPSTEKISWNFERRSSRSDAIWRMDWIPREQSVLQSTRYTIRILNRDTT